MAIGCFIGLILGMTVPRGIHTLNNSKYSRASLDKIMKVLVGKHLISDALTDELLIVAYDYNSQQPRFYSKMFANIEPNIYDVTFGNATGASSAAPTFFDPKVRLDGYGFKELQIDGGVICNNPAMYAYQMATDMYKEKKVRVMSIGTAEK